MRANHGVDRPSSHRRRVILTGLSALVLAGLHAPQARADILNFSAKTSQQTFPAAPIPVDLDGAPGVQAVLTFATPAPDLVEITFSAECSVAGAPPRYGTIEIQVDPAGGGGFAGVAPTVGNDDAFCSADATPGLNDGQVTASMTVVTRVPAGLHRVRVLANAAGGANQLHLDDLSITVDN